MASDRDVHGISKPKGLATLTDSTPGSTAAAVGDTLAAIQALVKADPASPILVPLLELAIAAADALGDAPTQLLGRRLLCVCDSDLSVYAIPTLSAWGGTGHMRSATCLAPNTDIPAPRNPGTSLTPAARQ